ncbi:hypothetical protein Poli38472_010686 [Pythium oligandrum]|uniref:Uncharacterized protein n=1 Tax=Pythium oligandrum TaxID=41045 RepID=A0A8K1CEN3_PYTOL|nr:hypothetical protein Poli38472_010686 [Pythium oligandrum]|eukprot:TMW61623.1 hypothetical protein Poli38472_010686 [Pythium oligandrum]
METPLNGQRERLGRDEDREMEVVDASASVALYQTPQPRPSDEKRAKDSITTAAEALRSLEWIPFLDDTKESDLRCRYRGGKCGQPRTLKRNGNLHTFCEFHRQRSIRNQKKFDQKRRLEGRREYCRSCRVKTDEELAKENVDVVIPIAADEPDDCKAERPVNGGFMALLKTDEVNTSTVSRSALQNIPANVVDTIWL